LYEKAVHILESYFDIDEGEDANVVPAVTAAGYSFGAPAPAAQGGAPAFNFGGPDASAASAGAPVFNFAPQQQ
jgi:hypothetical protein